MNAYASNRTLNGKPNTMIKNPNTEATNEEQSTASPSSTNPINSYSRTGKIARLPHALREELNQRLQDGEEGASLLDWLNALPDVRSVLSQHFADRPINPTNLYEW